MSGDLIADRLVHRFGMRTAMAAGVMLAAAGAGLLTLGMTADGSYLTALPGIVVAGLAGGIVWPVPFMAASTGVAAEEQGAAAGMASTALQVGAVPVLRCSSGSRRPGSKG